MSSLFERLKSGTEQQHREIEALVDPYRAFSSPEAYKIYLGQSWSFYQPLETKLGALDWSPTGFDFESRRKTNLLEHDLRVLQVPLPSVGPLGPTLERSSLDFAFGVMYVLEGATLGGQVISRHLAKLGIGPENGGLFFTGYGPRTGPMWKSFQATASAYCVREEQIEDAIRGAQVTFARFRVALQKPMEAAAS